MSSTPSPAPPHFSYAQAARGLQSVAASSQKSTDISAASSEKGARGHQSSSTDGEKLEVQPKSSDPTSAETTSPSTTKSLSAPRNSSVDSKEVVEMDCGKDSKIVGSPEESKTMASPTTVSLSESEPSGNSKDDELSIGPNGASETWERQSEASTSVEKGNTVHEKDKLQAGDDDWEKVSAPSLSQEKELKAAPPPTVNIWQQRKQAQEAKQREQTSQRPASSGGKASSALGPVIDSTKIKSGEKAAGAPEREAASKRKPVDATKSATEKLSQTQPAQGRPSSRGQQSASNLPPPPPVGDAVAWPTPDTANEADDRRKPSLETNDKVELKTSGAKQPKKWTQVPFVPTAVFNTPLPPAAAKRGGRGGLRGGRDGTSRGGHLTQNSVSGDKVDLGTSMGPPPLPRQGDQDRGRRPDATRGGRATSVPTQGRRSASTATTPVESRKVSGAGPIPAGPVSGDGPASGNAQESRSSSRPTDASSRAHPNANVDTPDPSLASENTHAHPIVDPAARTNTTPEWYSNKPGGGSTKPTGDPNTKERSQPRTRTFQESRDKVESWKDRDPQADTSGRRESRADRGGRGMYRGRGNNAGYVPGTSQHAYTAPLPQQPFAPQKSHSFNDSRQRQASQPYPMQPVSVGGRQNLRSQSIPVQNGMPPLSPIQTEMPGMYGYYPGQMLPGLMGHIPHHPALDMYGLMALVTAQLDYYFSIDNLCRDLYLRKHMDSQGFVSLRFLGDFKRIASMTRDMEMLRVSAAQSKIMEIRQGDDGEDRVRRRDGWEQWVLSNMEERDITARNAGPSAQSYQPRRPQYQYTGFAESPYSLAGPMRSPSWGVQGYNDVSGVMSQGFSQAISTNEHDINDHATTFQGPGSGMNGERNDASIPPSVPQGHSRSSSFVPAINGTDSNTNGHAGIVQNQEVPGSDQENIFPNEKVPNVWVYARKGEEDTPPFVSHATRTLSQGSRGGIDTSGNGLTSPTFVSGLRGGAASPEQIQRLHPLESLSIVDPAQQNGTFFLKEGVSQNDFDREGSDPWPYQVLHDKAVDQRDQGLHGPENHEMEILYQFWPTFLIQNFNAAMYKDFCRFALEDLSHGSTNGCTHLARYYGYRLSADKPLSDQIAHDIVAAIGQENGDARPVFQKVRAFWRDGAFNFKSRKRIDNLLDAGLREELGK